MIEQILLSLQLGCVIALFYQIKEENKNYKNICQQYNTLQNNPQPLSPTDLHTIIKQLHYKQQFQTKRGLQKTLKKIYFEHYSPSEIIFKNVYVAGITDTYFPIIPKNKQNSHKNLLYSYRFIEQKGGNFEFDKTIEKEIKSSPQISLNDANAQIEVDFNNAKNISHDEFDYVDIGQVVNIIKPQEIYKIVLTETEVGIGLGGILSIFGDVIYNIKDKTIRMQNTQYVGYGQKFLMSEIKNEKLMQEATLLFSIAVLIGGSIFFVMEGISQYKKWIKYKRDKLKQVYHVNYQNDHIYCQICKKKLKNVINLPCLHLDQCQNCVEDQQKNKNYLQSLKCQVCHQKISDFVPIFLA